MFSHFARPELLPCPWSDRRSCSGDDMLAGQALRELNVGCAGLQALDRIGLNIDFDELRRSRAAVPDAVLICGKAEALPIADNALRCVYSTVTLPYTNIPQALREIWRVLAPGGTAHLRFHDWWMWRERTWRSLRRGNWKDVTFQAYTLLNSQFLWFGTVMRFPLRRSRLESYQSPELVRHLLQRAGFGDVVVKRDHPHLRAFAAKPCSIFELSHR